MAFSFWKFYVGREVREINVFSASASLSLSKEHSQIYMDIDLTDVE